MVDKNPDAPCAGEDDLLGVYNHDRAVRARDNDVPDEREINLLDLHLVLVERQKVLRRLGEEEEVKACWK